MISVEPFQVIVFSRSDDRSARPRTAATNASRSGVATPSTSTMRRPANSLWRVAGEPYEKYATNTPSGGIPRCADMARWGACRTAPAQSSNRSMSPPSSAAVCTSKLRSAPSRRIVTLTCGARVARSTSRTRFNGRPSIASSRSPSRSTSAAGEPATRRATLKAWRCAPSSDSRLRTHSSGSPRLRAAEIGTASNSTSSEYNGRPSRAVSIEFHDEVDRHAAIDLHHVAAALGREARPERPHATVAPTTTPSKSTGGLTSVATSRLASRNCSVRDRGSFTSSIEATVVAIERTRESLPRPTTVTASPGTRSRGSRRAALIGVPSSSAGSNDSSARLCSGCT